MTEVKLFVSVRHTAGNDSFFGKLRTVIPRNFLFDILSA